MTLPESQTPTPAVVPMVSEVVLRNGRTRAIRTFEQSELSIEGEARLVGIARKIADVLAQTGYSWSQLTDVFTNEEFTDYQIVWDVVEKVGEYAPDLVADIGTILFAIYPTDENGVPNAAFEEDRTFLRGALNIRRLVEMFQTFVAQNDYRRLMAPFGLTLTETMAVLRGRPASADAPGSGAPSSDGSVVGLDGSPLDLMPEEPTETPSTPSTTEPPESANETSSDPSES